MKKEKVLQVLRDVALFVAAFLWVIIAEACRLLANVFMTVFVRPRTTRPIYWVVATALVISAAYFGPALWQTMPAVISAKVEKVVENTVTTKREGVPTRSLTRSAISAWTFGYDDKSNAQLPTTDFGEMLDRAWGGKHGSLTASTTGDTLVAEYRAAMASDSLHHLSLTNYLTIADQDARKVRAHLNWQGIAAKYRLNPSKLASLQHFARWYDGHAAGSYMLTELAPGKSQPGGVRNAKWINDLLRNAGREYVESLPALYDRKTSFGPFQFTEYALYDAKGGPRGASVMNRFLPESMQIPGSVKLLRGNMHFRAAFLFGLDNFARLLQKLNARQLAALETAVATNNEGVFAFVATAHHLPNDGIAAARKWIDHKVRHKSWLPFAVSCSLRLRLYANKNTWNELALRKYRSS